MEHYAGAEDLGAEPTEVFSGPPQAADLIRSVLEGSGIECAVWGHGLEHYGPGVAMQRIMVRSTDVERANEIILTALDGDLEIDDALDPDAVIYEDEPAGWVEASPGEGFASGPVTEVDAWWRRPELPQIVSVAMVIFATAAVLGLVYLLLVALAD